VHLARTERSDFQAFRVPGKRIYATQFHPELSMKANRERSIMYAAEYTRAGYADTFEEVIASFRASNAASNLLRRFVREILDLCGHA
jgi:GMP synthase-like glutamine amidotransferase